MATSANIPHLLTHTDDALAAKALSVILALMYWIVGIAQVFGLSGLPESFVRWGYPDWFRIAVGAAEVAGGALLLIPKVSAHASLALIVVMMGAAYTHIQSGEYPMLLLNGLLIALLGLLAWLRRPAWE